MRYLPTIWNIFVGIRFLVYPCGKRFFAFLVHPAKKSAVFYSINRKTFASITLDSKISDDEFSFFVFHQSSFSPAGGGLCPLFGPFFVQIVQRMSAPAPRSPTKNCQATRHFVQSNPFSPGGGGLCPTRFYYRT